MRQFLAALAQEVPENALFEVEDVVGPVGQVAVPQVLEHLGVAAEDAAGREFRGEVPFADQLDDFVDELRILHHLQVGGENRPVLLAQVSRRQLLVFGDFVADGLERRLKAGDFDFDRVDADVALGNAEVFHAENQRGPADHSGRDRDAAFDQHRVSNVNRRR